MKKKIKIVQDINDKVPVQLLATAIRDLATGMRKLLAADLKEETIVLLLHDASGISKPNIRQILKTMVELDQKFLKKPRGN